MSSTSSVHVHTIRVSGSACHEKDFKNSRVDRRIYRINRFCFLCRWCLHENYKTGEWSESCGTVLTNPRYRECKQRRVWVPKELDASAGLKPKFDPNEPYADVTIAHSAFKTMWMIVDPYQEYGGTFVGPAPSVPENIRNHPCVEGSWFFHKKFQWVCVESAPQMNLPDDLIVTLVKQE
jgi:hypothetical protein